MARRRQKIKEEIAEHLEALEPPEYVEKIDDECENWDGYPFYEEDQEPLTTAEIVYNDVYNWINGY